MINTSISISNKDGFKAIEVISNGAKLRWGKKNEPESPMCTYEYYVYKGSLTPYVLDNIILKDAKREASIKEYIEFLYAMNIQEDERIKLLKIKIESVIKNYDTSSDVNQFYVQDNPIWLDKATRAGLLLRFQAEQAQEVEDTALWYDGMQFPLKVSQAIQMLYAIEMYASACYDNTQRHLAAVKELKTIEEIQNYDYRTGYPEKLRF